MKKIGGFNRKTRSKFKKHARDKGKISLSRYLQVFQPGDKVMLAIEPAFHKGRYHPRFMGKVGTIIGKPGKCYEIKISDSDKEKTLVVHPVHLRSANVIPKSNK
ncbi:50S ribosomal protein L21e [Candidatus Woesearchaeota archaeon]|nr:50S ribosomal protein L21e [Candidatus Woesearchaeota archaeon]